MLLTDKLIFRYGYDKLLHVTIYGWIVAIASIFNIYASLITFLILLVFSIFKEKKLDTNYDKKDVLYGCVGGLISIVFVVIKVIFKL